MLSAVYGHNSQHDGSVKTWMLQCTHHSILLHASNCKHHSLEFEWSNRQSACGALAAALPSNLLSPFAQQPGACSVTGGCKWSEPPQGTLDPNCTANQKETADEKNGVSFTSKPMYLQLSGVSIFLLYFETESGWYADLGSRASCSHGQI